MQPNVASARLLLITNRHSPVVTGLYYDNPGNLAGIIHCHISAPDTQLLAFAEEHAIPLFPCQTIGTNVQKIIEELQVDIGVVYALHLLLPKSVFSMPRYGFLNLHPSLLPDYRGPNPLFWQYYDGIEESGFTVHQIDEKEDHGCIYGQARFQLDYTSEHNAFLDKKLVEVGVPLLCDVLHNHESIVPVAQPELSNTRRARNLTPDVIKDLLLTMPIEKQRQMKRLYPMLELF